MFKRIGALVGLLLLGACATQAGFENRINPTIGMTEAQLVAYAGKPPDQTYVPDATNTASEPREAYGPHLDAKGKLIKAPVYLPAEQVKFLSWTMTGTNSVPGYWQCIRGFCWVQAPTTYTLVCTLNFELRDGIVRSYKYHGNSCVG